MSRAVQSVPVKWLNPKRGTEARDFLLHEKLRAYLSAYGSQTRFFPLLDSYTEETPEIRRQYPVMLRDPYVKSALFTKTLAVASLDPQVQAASERRRDKRASDFVQYILTRPKSSTRKIAFSVIIHGLLAGYSITELVWHPVERGRYRNKIGLANVKAKDPRYLTLEGDQYRNVTGVRDHRAGQVYNPSNFLIWTNYPIYSSPIGMSDLRAAYRAFWLLDTSWRLRMIGLERFGLPVLKGTFATPEQQDKLEAALPMLRSQSWITIPEGAQVEALDLAARGTVEFQQAINDLREEIVVGITGAVLQMLQGQVSDGRGSSQVHKSTSELYQWWIAAEVGDLISEQLSPALTAFNYRRADAPLVTLGGVNDDSMQGALAIDTGLSQLGLELSKDELYRKYGRQKPVKEDDKLAPMQAGQQGGAPDAGGPPGLPFSESSIDLGRFAEQVASAVVKRMNGRKKRTRRAKKQVAMADDDAGPAVNQVAGPHQDFDSAEELLAASQKQGFRVLRKLAKQAVGRQLKQPTQELFTEEEREKFSSAIANTTAAANLLGRYRIRKLQERAESGVKRFAEQPVLSFAEPIGPMTPLRALAFFQSLNPDMNISRGFPDTITQEAVQLAAASEQSLLGRVHNIIEDTLRTGQVELRNPVKQIESVLNRAGLTPANPQYAEMVFRTNAMRAYNEGATQELQQSDVQETFPVWQYLGIRDGRQGKDHEPKFDRYYPNGVSFGEVRGERVFNCRCTSRPVSRWEWAKLQKRGAKLETKW